ncbi:MAG: hypothetical protein ACP5SH_06720 [Syntrophobacteraceae bacterium]
MEPPRSCLWIPAILAVCFAAALVCANRADAFMPGEWDGGWSSTSSNSSGAMKAQLYSSGSTITGGFTLSNSQWTGPLPIASGVLRSNLLSIYAPGYGCSFTFTSMNVQNLTLSGNYDIYCEGNFYDQGSFSLTYAGVSWQNAVNLGGGWWESWFGVFNTNASPWIYHQTLGWLYPYGDPANSLWAWVASLNAFCWTSQTMYPYLYRVGSPGGWILYIQGTSDPQTFFDFTTNTWFYK